MNKYTFQLFSILLFSAALISCSSETDSDLSPDQEAAAASVYDEQLAAELGADEYGMRRYIMAFLKAGPNRSQSDEEASRLQRAHLDNITRLANEGVLVMAGPFLDSGEVRGIYVFAVDSIEEARELSETDPAIQAGRLELELHPWYGSAALMQMGELHEKISKLNP